MNLELEFDQYCNYRNIGISPLSLKLYIFYQYSSMATAFS